MIDKEEFAKILRKMTSENFMGKKKFQVVIDIVL
jgi:hypothetical protein